MDAAGRTVRLVCKESKCGRIIEIELASLVTQKSRAICPYCGKKRTYRIDDFLEPRQIPR